ncbi:hypothetical protein BDV96DRAFT_657953 [Lophiotrema nucula]|uniref:Uncharacterized protein n=1 Tax=Lophiotrema nucula TaxID=690887 RepID=A0A6A5ZB88_9PLEO|nr:hypothetical protein BDV96DRAFT_657953 [Lophiotrema nucula]
MAEAQLQSILLRQPFDIRLVLYSHIDLPPFSECRDYSGFFLCCRQVKDEIGHEATLQIKLYLSDLEKHEDNKDARLNLIPPASAFNSPTITVRIPFDYPEDRWHHDAYTISQRNVFDFTYRHKSFETHESIAPTIRPLLSLFLSCINFELVPTEDTIHRITEEETQFADRSNLIQHTPLGVLIGQYSSLDVIARFGLHMHCTGQQVLNTTNMTLQWDFRPPGQCLESENNGEWLDGPKFDDIAIRGAQHTDSFTMDRRAGRVEWDLDKQCHAKYLERKRVEGSGCSWYDDVLDREDWGDELDWELA